MTVSILPKGTNFVRYLIAKAIAGGESSAASEIAASRWGSESHAARLCKTAATAASTIPDETWGSVLVEYDRAAAEFFELVAAMSVTGRMAALRRVPLRTRTITPTAGSTGFWVGEAGPVPVSQCAFAEDTLPAYKVGAMIVATTDLLRSADPLAEAVLRRDLARACAETLDTGFIHPDSEALEGTRPASITYGVTPIPSQGADLAAIRADMLALLEGFAGDLQSSYLLMTPETAAALAVMGFENIGAKGGEFGGLPVVPTSRLAGDSSGSCVVLADAGSIAFGEGRSEVRTSTQGTIEMSSTPTTDAATPTATEQVSLWQTGSVALMAIRDTGWAVQRPGAVALLSGVNWGAIDAQ